MVLHSSAADVDAVLVDGHFRKRNGPLRSIKLDPMLAPEIKPDKTELEWYDREDQCSRILHALFPSIMETLDSRGYSKLQLMVLGRGSGSKIIVTKCLQHHRCR
ncbi:hypothetical protein V1519DRAFT_443745 [Lipomyces tetrasporus]